MTPAEFKWVLVYLGFFVAFCALVYVTVYLFIARIKLAKTPADLAAIQADLTRVRSDVIQVALGAMPASPSPMPAPPPSPGTTTTATVTETTVTPPAAPGSTKP